MADVSNLTTFYIVRHGTTDWNTQHLIQGHTDVVLNDTGKLEAKQLAGILKNVHFDAAFSSDLARTRETIEIIALEHKLAVNTTKLLRERNFGVFEGESHDHYHEESKKFLGQLSSLSREERFKTRLGDGYENDEEIIARFTRILREIAVAYPGKTVLIGAHSSIMRTLLIYLGWATHEELLGGSGAIDNTAYLKLASDGTDFFIQELSGIRKTNA